MNDSNRPVDITGLMQVPVNNWQERVEKLAKPEFWIVDVTPKFELWDRLTKEERRRLEVKMDLIAESVRWMLAGMVKGTIKYNTDDYPMDRWMAHLVGEGADQMNYQLLLFAAYHRQKEEHEKALQSVRDAWQKNKS